MKIWKTVKYVLMAFQAMAVIVWWNLLGNICSSPSNPSTATRHIVQYNCHGQILYITPAEDFLLHWLIPILIVVMLIGKAIDKHTRRLA